MGGVGGVLEADGGGGEVFGPVNFLLADGVCTFGVEAGSPESGATTGRTCEMGCVLLEIKSASELMLGKACWGYVDSSEPDYIDMKESAELRGLGALS